MNLIYYAHSYREPDVGVVKFFSKLMDSEGLVPSLDPPSDHLNSAKPERHLGSTDGMVAVLTVREGGPSLYILYEISLCLRSRKPLLVFVEDQLPSGVVPSWVLQRRFSRRGLLRQVRDHRHALQSLKAYIGEDPPPPYQPSIDQRRCLLTGTHDLSAEVRGHLEGNLKEDGYRPVFVSGNTTERLYDTELQETLKGADLSLVFLDSSENHAEFFAGALHARLAPAILLTRDANFPFHPAVPREYQARIVSYSDPQVLWGTIAKEISIFEEEYVDLKDQEAVSLYADLLISQASTMDGRYGADMRGVFVKELFMGDKNVNLGQAGSMGTGSTGTINNYSQVWQQNAGKIDLAGLASELPQLRSELRKKAETTEQDKAIAAVGEAEDEAKKGNGPGVMEKLAKAGEWVLDVAKDIGSKVAVEAIKASLGL